MPVPPWFAMRVLPGIGIAVTAAYVGYQVFQLWQQEREKEVQQQQQQQQQELTTLMTRATTTATNEQDIDRRQLCVWLGMSEDGKNDVLDAVPSHRLAACLEALSYTPVAIRPMLVPFFYSSNNKKEDDENDEKVVQLLASLHDFNNDDGEDDYLAANHLVFLLNQHQTTTTTQSPDNIIMLLVQALESCAVQDRPELLSKFYALSNLQLLDSLLLHLPPLLLLDDDNNGDKLLYQVVEALVHLPAKEEHDHDSNCLISFVRIWIRLVASATTASTSSTTERCSGFLRALKLAATAKNSDENKKEKPDYLLLLTKLDRLQPVTRLEQVTTCFARFPDAVVCKMMTTLTTSTLTKDLQIQDRPDDNHDYYHQDNNYDHLSTADSSLTTSSSSNGGTGSSLRNRRSSNSNQDGLSLSSSSPSFSPLASTTTTQIM